MSLALAVPPNTLRILILEDNPNDAELMTLQLRKAGLDFTAKRVETRAHFVDALESFAPDILLADCDVPGCTGAEALAHVRQSHPEIPAVMVTGLLNEEGAIELLKAGAADHVLKSNLIWLPAAVERAISAGQDARARKDAEAAARKSMRMLQAAERVGHVGAWEWDMIHDVMIWSDETYRIHRQDPQHWTPSVAKFVEAVHPDDRMRIQQAIANSLAKIAPFDEEFRVILPDGSERIHEVRAEPILDQQGNPTGAMGISYDITERKRAEGKIREDEARFRSLIEQEVAGIYVLGADASILYANPYFLQILGYAESEVFGRPVLDFVPDAEKPGLLATIGKLLSGEEKSVQLITRLIGKDGQIRDFLTQGRVADYGGKPAITGVAVDITEQRRAEAKTRESEARFRFLVEQAPEAILVYDVDQDRFIDANKNAEKLFGCGRDELLRLGPKHFYSPDQPDERPVDVSFAEHNRRALEEPLVYERRIHSAQGREVFCEVRLGRLPSAEGRLLRASFIDITERRLATNELRQERDLSAALLASLPGFFVLIDEGGRLAQWNENWSSLFIGVSDDQVRGSDALATVVEDDRDRARETMREAFTRGTADAEFDVRTKSGEVRTMHINGRTITSGGHPYLVTIGTDTTEQRSAERQLRESKDRFRAIFESVNDAIFLSDPNTGKFLDVNRRGCDMFGYSREEIVTGDIEKLSSGVPPYSRREALERLEKARSGRPQLFEWQGKAKDGRLFWIEISLSSGSIGERDMTLALIRDTTERKRLDATIRLQADQYTTMLGTTQDGFWSLDRDGRFIEVNDAFCRMMGYSREELLKLRIGDIETIGAAEPVTRRLASIMSTGFERFEWRRRRKDGVAIDIEASVSFWLNGDRFLGFVRDVTERKQAAEQMRKLARQDFLTGLANREVFVERLQLAIARARRGAGNFAVLYLDLDHFKDVNDTLGHAAGDLLLRAVAERLRTGIRGTDTVARFGGDEFAVIASDIRDPADAAILADKLLMSIGAPFLVEGNSIRCGTSVGIAVFGPDTPDAETLLSQADMALYRSKSEGRGTYRFFTEAMDTEVRTRVALAVDLREAITAGQFFLAYQPQVDVDTGRIIGLEALARWRHPIRGLVPPGEFIPAAEKGGLIVALGHWVLREACRQMKEWGDAGIAPPLIGVNVSSLQFKAHQELENDIASTLAEFSLPPEVLELELTESVLFEASREHNDVLLRLRKTGVRIAIDDFGNGYSSLEYLSRFPVDRIKIAQNFVAGLPAKPRNSMIVRAAIRLGHELGLHVVVEGVETAAELELIRLWSAREVQGFYFSRPIPAAEMTALLRGRTIKVPADADTPKRAGRDLVKTVEAKGA